MTDDKNILVLTNSEGKVCDCCGRTLPLEGFYRSRKSPDTYQSWCRDCQRDYAYKRRQDQKVMGNEFSSLELSSIPSRIDGATDQELRSYRRLLLAMGSKIDRELECRKRRRKN